MLLDKQALRLYMKKKRLTISKESLFLQSQNIHKQLLNHPLLKQSSMIGCYVNLPYEVETQTLIVELLKEHRVCVPKVVNDEMVFYEIKSLNDLKEGYFHVLEPITDHIVEGHFIDFMIIPLVACDNKCHRLGYGKGFYDRYLSYNYDGYKCGVAYLWQIVDYIPYDHYDQLLDEIIVPKMNVIK